MNTKPRVSVLMPVYNGEKYLRKAIDSILHQDYCNYEFIIINDGSTDNSADIVRSYRDERIKYLENATNIGLPSTLNIGIEAAVGEYIVRMDQDDISMPERIKKQVIFMDNHPEVGICGTWIRFIGVPYRPWRSVVYKYPTQPKKIMAKSLFDSVFAHPSVIMRRSLLDKFRLRYDSEDLHGEDRGLWQKSVFCFPLANIPEILLLYRVCPQGMTIFGKGIWIETFKRITRSNIQNLGIDFSPEELFIRRNHPIDFGTDFLFKFHSWLEKVQQANSVKQVYPEPEFSQALSEEWFSACYRSSCLGIDVWRLFWQMPLGSIAKLDMQQNVRFLLKSALSRSSVLRKRAICFL